MSAPALRFKSFGAPWINKKLGDIASKIGSGSTPRGGSAVYKTFGIPFIRSQNVNSGKLLFDDVIFISEEIHSSMSGTVVKANDILLNITGASIGRTCIVPINFKEGNVNQHVCIIRPRGEYCPKFIQSFLSSSLGQNLIQSTQVGGGREGLNFQAIRGFNIGFPGLDEQKKIAAFLSAIDEKINQLAQKHELLEQYKKGVMQKIFSQKIRLKDDLGGEFPEWRTEKLGNISKRVKRKNAENNKNALTISAQHGLINQLDYFNKSIASKNLTNYYLLHKGEFAYNKSYSSGYPMGAIKKLNQYDKGCVSTLYIPFKFNEDVSTDFFEHYFENGLHNSEIEKIAQEGARNHGLLNVGILDFFEINVNFPSFKEQIKIAKFLSFIDEKISNAKSQIEAIKQYKKGLLQQMFV
jgi:type I restriction enzyme S subunit